MVLGEDRSSSDQKKWSLVLVLQSSLRVGLVHCGLGLVVLVFLKHDLVIARRHYDLEGHNNF